MRRPIWMMKVKGGGGSSKSWLVGLMPSPDELRTDLFSDDEGGYVDCVAPDAALLKTPAVADSSGSRGRCAGRFVKSAEDALNIPLFAEPEAATE